MSCIYHTPHFCKIWEKPRENSLSKCIYREMLVMKSQAGSKGARKMEWRGGGAYNPNENSILYSAIPSNLSFPNGLNFVFGIFLGLMNYL